MPRAYRAPGRVNLIGDHTDYNDGFVMPMAIQLETVVRSSPRSDRQLTVHSSSASGDVAVDLDQPLQPQHNWSDYVVGVAWVLLQERQPLDGADLSITSTIPQGSGLSSSAALEVASAFALLKGNVPARTTLARWCQRAENEFVGARVGIMDQYVACHGEAGHALLIDCRTLQSRSVRVPPSAAVIVSNTMVKHSIASGEYNNRRAQCEEAVQLIRTVAPAVRALRDVTLQILTCAQNVLSGIPLKRARHVVRENARVVEAAEALDRADLHTVGRLMNESHASLRDDFEVSAPELDQMVEIATSLPGVYGSRMTGGGFGGCTVTLADARAADAIVSAIRDKYAAGTGVIPEVIICVPSARASELPA